VRFFFNHAGRLSSRTANHTPGKIDPVKDGMTKDLVNGIMPAHITALYDTRTPIEKR